MDFWRLNGWISLYTVEDNLSGLSTFRFAYAKPVGLAVIAFRSIGVGQQLIMPTCLKILYKSSFLCSEHSISLVIGSVDSKFLTLYEAYWVNVRWKLCSTDTSIMEPCRVRNVSGTHVGHTYRVWFLIICHVFTCRVHFNVAMFVQHRMEVIVPFVEPRAL